MADAAHALALEIVTPERRVLAEAVDEVVLPGEAGYFGVRPGHAPLLARLAPGELQYRVAGKTAWYAVSGGYAEVQRERVTVLAETCERADEIDLERAQRARERAEAQLQSQLAEAEFRAAQVALERAVNRIAAHARGRGMMS